VGGRRAGDSFWLVSEFGTRSQYVRNIEADPRVRVRIRGRWHEGTAHLLPDDDPVARLRRLPRINSLGVRALGTDLCTRCTAAPNCWAVNSGTGGGFRTGGLIGTVRPGAAAKTLCRPRGLPCAAL
jgi:deazaflavin-dependent oxidoreductase (nitroreductase family)